MGLAFSHGKASWSYSGFMDFRTRIINTIGIPGDLKIVYGDGSYKFLINDPIYPFINHSDCDGELSVDEMEKVAPRLQEIIDIWKADSHDDYDVINGEELVEGMETAINENNPLEFY